jgi:dinuclear metal center YbgI/SA1388 family protein
MPTNNTIKEIIEQLERVAPPSYQESYDNSGLIIGEASTIVTGVLICLDSTEAVVEEAIEKGCNLIIAHHPIVFKGLKRFNGKNYVERTILKAIKNDIAIYAIHTNLDNQLYQGVNTKIGEMLGITQTKILVPKVQTLMKLSTFVPVEQTETVLKALFEAGAGQLGDYEHCSFRTLGVGSFKPLEGANPFIGAVDKEEKVVEYKVEVLFERHLQGKIVAALQQAHPYEEVLYYLYTLENANNAVGSGMIGILYEPKAEKDFLKHLKKTMKAGVVRYTGLRNKPISRVAWCGGSGGFLLNAAIAQGADIFITSDYKYHEFFDADGRIIIADIGHFESEQYTIELIFDIISKKFSNFAVNLTQVNTNPVNYL